MKIGIPGYEIDGMFGVHSSYMEFATIVGDPEILTPKVDWANNLKHLDGILLPGGADVYPGRYGLPGFFTGSPRQHLEYFDTEVLPQLIGKLPIFGICRGLQTINVVLGGSLLQHLYTHPRSGDNLDFVHGVKSPNTQEELFKVNSFHHQALGNIGRGLREELVSTDKEEVTEAISSTKLKIFAVQWHPERSMDTYSVNKFIELFK